MQKLCRKAGKKDDGKITPAGAYYGKVDIAVIKDKVSKNNYLYFVNVEKQNKFEEEGNENIIEEEKEEAKTTKAKGKKF